MSQNPLQHEIGRFNTELQSLLANEGRFAMVQGDSAIEVFDTYDDAHKAGYEKFGLTPFLVQKISRVPIVANFTRFSLVTCQA